MLEDKPTPPAEGNQISHIEKIVAGLLLIFFTLLPAVIIIAYWPDKIPGPKDNVLPLYSNRPFHVNLAGIPDELFDTATVIIKKADTTYVNGDSSKTIVKVLQEKKEPSSIKEMDECGESPYDKCLIHINTIIMLLVAAAGFIGNMIHIASSFTNFIGAGKFVRTWMLWYFVKPFTAAALALGLYFVFRGGFLNYNADASGINLYGILTISLLAGLFTDRATLKLAEVFDVIFSIKKESNKERPDSLEGDEPVIAAVTPDKLESGKINKLVISGNKLDKKILLIKMNDVVIPVSDKKADSISFDYSIPEEDKDKTSFTLTVHGEDGKEYFKTELAVVSAAAVPETPAGGDAKDTGDADDTNDDNPLAKG